MKKLLQLLFGSRQTPVPLQADNAMEVNEVLSRYRTAPTRPAPAPRSSGPGEADAPRERKLEFDLSELVIDEPRREEFNPYDTGRFSTADLWEKRHRDRLT